MSESDKLLKGVQAVDGKLSRELGDQPCGELELKLRKKGAIGIPTRMANGDVILLPEVAYDCKYFLDAGGEMDAERFRLTKFSDALEAAYANLEEKGARVTVSDIGKFCSAYIGVNYEITPEAMGAWVPNPMMNDSTVSAIFAVWYGWQKN